MKHWIRKKILQFLCPHLKEKMLWQLTSTIKYRKAQKDIRDDEEPREFYEKIIRCVRIVECEECRATRKITLV